MNNSWESADKTVRKDVLRRGIFSRKPTENSTCDVLIENINMQVSVEDLKNRFHSEILDGSIRVRKVVLGEANCELDRKIERAIQMMALKEKSLVTVHIPSVKDTDDPPVTVKFEITLLEFQLYQPIWEWTTEEKYTIALRHKDAGVQLFKESRYVDAFHKFSKACKILITLEPIPDLELDSTLEANIANLRTILYNNMAGCHLNRNNFEHTITLCTKILERDANNIKALYRRGVAYGNLKNVEKAVDDLKAVVNLEPNNAIAKKQLHLYNEKLQIANQKFEDMVKRMFKA